MSKDGSNRRLPRVERRQVILDAAIRAFASEGGYPHTGLDEVAALAGVTRMILYRHFDSKQDLYRAAIDHAAVQLHAVTVGAGGLDETSLPRLVDWAGEHPEAFRLLFRHAAHEPEFRDQIHELRTGMAATIRPYLDEEGFDRRWAGWAAQLAVGIVVEAVMAWLDNDMPEPEHAGERIVRTIAGAVRGMTEPPSDRSG